MAVPAHDVRDNEFAKKYELDIIPVIRPVSSKISDDIYTGDGHLINSDKYNEMTSNEAKEVIVKDLVKNDGKSKVQYRLNDWGVSRQRYWAAPFQ